MNFSGAQWLAVIITEILARTVTFIVLYFPVGFLLFPLSLLHSALHFFLIFLTSSVVKLFNLNRRAYFWLVILLTNVFFAASMAFFQIAFAKSQQRTSCVGVLRQECSWIEGQITAAGIRNIATIDAIQVAINIFPIFLMIKFFNRAERKTALAGQLSA